MKFLQVAVAAVELETCGDVDNEQRAAVVVKVLDSAPSTCNPQVLEVP